MCIRDRPKRAFSTAHGHSRRRPPGKPIVCRGAWPEISAEGAQGTARGTEMNESVLPRGDHSPPGARAGTALHEFPGKPPAAALRRRPRDQRGAPVALSLIHISEPTRLLSISY